MTEHKCQYGVVSRSVGESVEALDRRFGGEFGNSITETVSVAVVNPRLMRSFNGPDSDKPVEFWDDFLEYCKGFSENQKCKCLSECLIDSAKL